MPPLRSVLSQTQRVDPLWTSVKNFRGIPLLRSGIPRFLTDCLVVDCATGGNWMFDPVRVLFTRPLGVKRQEGVKRAGADTIKTFHQDFAEHGGKPEQVEVVCYDVS